MLCDVMRITFHFNGIYMPRNLARSYQDPEPCQSLCLWLYLVYVLTSCVLPFQLTNNYNEIPSYLIIVQPFNNIKTFLTH